MPINIDLLKHMAQRQAIRHYASLGALVAALVLSVFYLIVAGLFHFDPDFQWMALWLWASPVLLFIFSVILWQRAQEYVTLLNQSDLLDITDPVEAMRQALSGHDPVQSWRQKLADYLDVIRIRQVAMIAAAASMFAFLVQGNLYMLFDYEYSGQGAFKRYEVCNYYTALRPKKVNIGRAKESYCDLFVLYRGKVAREPKPDIADLYRPPTRLPPPLQFGPPPGSNQAGNLYSPNTVYLPPIRSIRRQPKVTQKPVPVPPPPLPDPYLSKKTIRLSDPNEDAP